MPLILAFEPNRDRAPQLASVARRLNVDFILSESIEEALRALDDRVPDLILIPALLSRKDDAAFADRLRELGAAASHVHTLTIPILAAPEVPPPGGVLRALRRQKPRRSTPDGCDPDVFAGQIRVYLRRAAEAREAHPLHAAEAPPVSAGKSPQAGDEAPAILQVSPIAVVEDSWPLSENGLGHHGVDVPVPVSIAPEPCEPPQASIAPDPAEPAAAAVEAQPLEPVVIEIDTAVCNRIEDVFALAPLPADQDTAWVAVALDELLEAAARWPAPADAGISTDNVWMLTPVTTIEELIEPPAASPDPAPVDTGADNVWMLTPVPEMELVVPPPPDPPDIATVVLLTPIYDLPESPAASPEPFLLDTGADNVWMLTPVPEMELVVPPPAEPPDTMTVVLLTPVYDLPPEPVEAVAAAPSVDAQPPSPEVAAPPPNVMAAPAPATTRRRKAVKPKPKPVQDEWGFFDPSQCGFAALVDKLDEITAGGTASETSDEVTVRVISY